MLRDGSIEMNGGASSGIGVAGGTHRDLCERLHRRLKRIIKARGALDLEEAAALREAQRLMIWRTFGYASLLEYMELEMGYSPRAAVERLRVAHAIVDLPQIAGAMEQGDLSFSAARELTRVATPETEGAWLGEAEGKNLREIEAAVSGRKRGARPTDPADPALKTRVLRLEVREELFALWRQVMQAIEKEKGERVDDNTVVEVLCRGFLSGKLADARDVAAYQLAVTICEVCKRGWQDGGGIVAELSPPAVERAQCDAQHIGSLDGNETQRATQTIPPAIRRKVKRRDHNRCRVPGCRSYRNIDVHHIVPRERGGTNTIDNLACLCESHHLALHDGTIAITVENGELVFEREGRHNLTRAKRAEDTRLVLKGLCFEPEEIKRAVDKTKTHVGTADLSLEQWIRIALGYCPSARTDRPSG